MVASGDWLLPRQSGEVYPDKPPGVYWLMASAIAVLGPSAFAVRLPALLALALLALLLHRRARSSLGEEAATVAVLILLAEPLLLVLGQLATLDMVLSALVCAGMLAGRRLLLEGGWRSAAFCGAALGGAFLVKGPVGPALTLAVLLVTSLLERRAARALRLLHPALWLPLAAIGLPWYWAAAAAEPGLLDFWIGREVVGRLSSDVHARAQPLWFFPALVAAISLPWLAGLLSAQRRGTVCGDPGERLFHAVWAFLPVLLFTLPQGKQPAYYAPAVPGLALWLAADLSALSSRGARLLLDAPLLLLSRRFLRFYLLAVLGPDQGRPRAAPPSSRGASRRGA
ncbi:MAG: glycosyltransferase family 39 protein, partial [Planctomycetes bacterium]|nr:glycosyltransferase family 39 protein [Planctomycetota bacterium]